ILSGFPAPCQQAHVPVWERDNGERIGIDLGRRKADGQSAIVAQNLADALRNPYGVILTLSGFHPLGRDVPVSIEQGRDALDLVPFGYVESAPGLRFLLHMSANRDTIGILRR